MSATDLQRKKDDEAYVHAMTAPGSPEQRSIDQERPADVEKAEHAQHAPRVHVIPDGGVKAWLTVLGAWLVLFATFGLVNAFGVFQDYYTRIYLSNKTSSDISWIGSVQIFVQFSMGFVAGPFFDQGYFHHLMIFGSVLYIFSLFMLSLAQQYQFYQVFLSQGIGAGLGLGIIFLPAVGVISHHFRVKRALAMGIAFSGSSTGGIIFPIMLNRLLNGSLGFGNSVRATAGLAGGTLLIGNLLMRQYQPPRLPGAKARPAFNKLFTDAPYMMSIVSVVFLWLGLFFPIFYIQLDSILHNVDTTLSFYTVTFLNAASVIGRLLPNFVADKVGTVNMMIFTAISCMAVIIGMLGLDSNSIGAPIALSVMYGFFSGGLVALVGAMIASLSPTVNEIGIRTGLTFLFGGVAALVGTPITGAVLGDDFVWWKGIVFSAVTVGCGVVGLFLTRHGLVKRKGTPFV